MSVTAYSKGIITGKKLGATLERQRCLAELAVCRWIAPKWALDEVETPGARLIDEDPLPEGWDVESSDSGECWTVDRFNDRGSMIRTHPATSYKAAVRLAWALEQGLEL